MVLVNILLLVNFWPFKKEKKEPLQKFNICTVFLLFHFFEPFNDKRLIFWFWNTLKKRGQESGIILDINDRTFKSVTETLCLIPILFICFQILRLLEIRVRRRCLTDVAIISFMMIMYYVSAFGFRQWSVLCTR